MILAYSEAEGRAAGDPALVLGHPNSCDSFPGPHPDHGDRIYPMNLSKTLFIAPFLLLCTVLLAACGGGSGSSSPSATTGGTITLYNGQHEQTTGLLVKAFERQTHIKVKIRSGDEAELGNQIIQEGSNSPADVFYTENTPVLEELQEKGLLAPVAASTLSSVPRKDDAASGDWVGVSARVSALVYNTSKTTASALPGSILELASPQWK